MSTTIMSKTVHYTAAAQTAKEITVHYFFSNKTQHCHNLDTKCINIYCLNNNLFSYISYYTVNL